MSSSRHLFQYGNTGFPGAFYIAPGFVLPEYGVTEMTTALLTLLTIVVAVVYAALALHCWRRCRPAERPEERNYD
ncbi:hypothetical protein KGP26_12030 [Serratia sp. JSRIV002]|uniref:hypothetical protein n=1 Tax=Serratia sp. JSRIV002 TaxID=2831894 RepID=UPI001CC06184|nr:hypothetical protein [Serratia sp. JSRIV002]UAN53730.1 hypothetical protein KGP26_12030 [Serratia sp. JSRIV002]